MKNEHGKNANHGNDVKIDNPILRPRGDYQTLLSFRKAEVIYDITFRFAHKYLSRGDRTIDQMIQSARSGKQNSRSRPGTGVLPSARSGLSSEAIG